jgi:hypothetical protein
MASTDIDGSIMVILSSEEATAVYQILKLIGRRALTKVEMKTADKISRDLSLEPLK